jgi:hypothetical protein
MANLRVLLTTPAIIMLLRVSALLLFASFATCAPAVPRMHARLDADPVRFFHEYKGKEIVVQGHVGTKNLASRDRARVDLIDFGPVIAGEVKHTTDVLSVLEFDPARRVVCYFEPSELDSVAQVEVGERVSAECRVAGVQEAGGQPIVQLSRCTLVER